MAIINTSREVSATIDRVWNIIADIDNEPMYWHTGAVNNIIKNGNIVKREVMVPFRNSVSSQIVVMNPKKSIETKLIKGPIIGTRFITLSSSEYNRTKIEVLWDIELSGIPTLFRSFARDHMTKDTQEAVNRIAKAAEVVK